MSSEWRTVKLTEVASEVTVGFVGTMANEYVDSGVPFLRSLNVDRFKIDTAEIKYISPRFHSRISKSCLRPGDVVIVRTGKPGVCAVIPDDLPESNCSDLVIVRCGSEILNRFLCYYVNSAVSNHIAAHLVGAVQQHFNVASAKAMEIPLPSIREQKAIAHILGTLDDKIELNRKTNETLEAMAKALFKSWFVDFDPVRAKAEGRPTGLPAEISDLFPDSFEDSELGDIPSGWVTGTIGSIAQVIDCLHSKKPDQQENGKQLLQLNNIEDNGLLDQSQKYLISADDYDKWSSRIEVREGDCVITNVGRVGAVAQIPKGVIAAMGRNMTAIRLKDAFPHPTFLLEYLLSSLGREEIRLNIDEGTILNALNVKSIPGLRFFRSSDFILNAYEKSARPLREEMEGSLKENQSLSALRDALLPKLISGEIRIPDAERMLEEVGV